MRRASAACNATYRDRAAPAAPVRTADPLVVTAPSKKDLAPEEYVTIGTLTAQGYSSEEIAELVGRSPRMVEKAKAIVKPMMRYAAPEMLEYWRQAAQVSATKGFHQPSKEWLEAAGAIERPKSFDRANVMQVQVITQSGASITLPGLPPPTTIDVTPEE